MLTPGGNWSSYPPHKHDEDVPGVETVLEEIYYFEVAGGGFGYQRVYSPGRSARSTSCRRSAPATAIDMPSGYHGPSMAAPATTSTTSTSWPAPASARGASPTTPPTRGSATRGPTRSSIRDCPSGGKHETDRRPSAGPVPRVQYSERDGIEQRLIPGCFGIFGHGNVAGVGQALLENQDAMPFYHARNEQAMVHTAAAFARQKNRLATLACTSSVGPGATNLVTGAALATINRLPGPAAPGRHLRHPRVRHRCCRSSRARPR